ncbi:13487_t:CDS:1, partial [Funneliformis caledonium]
INADLADLIRILTDNEESKMNEVIEELLKEDEQDEFQLD